VATQLAPFAQGLRIAPGDAISEEVLREEMNERCEQMERRIDEDGRSVGNELLEQRAGAEFGSERLDKALHAISAGIARLERKLDRILALVVEGRGRH